jgi:hypothetical protein
MRCFVCGVVWCVCVCDVLFCVWCGVVWCGVEMEWNHLYFVGTQTEPTRRRRRVGDIVYATTPIAHAGVARGAGPQHYPRTQSNIAAAPGSP